MYKCSKCGFNDCHMTIWKTKKGNLQVTVCKECGDMITFITKSPCTNETWGINSLAHDIHQNAKDHGWWDNPSPDGTQVALFHAELSEALECMRKGDPAEYFHIAITEIPTFGMPQNLDVGKRDMAEFADIYKGEKTEGWATELADCVIRIFDFLVAKGIDVEDVIRRKHNFNKTREYKHGKRF